MSHKSPPKPQTLRFDRLTPQELSPEEQEVYHRAIAEGMYWGLLDYPLLITDEETLFSLADTFCKEEGDRKRIVFETNWASGYLGVVKSSRTNRNEAEAMASAIKVMPRAQAVLLLLSQLVAESSSQK